MFRRKLYVAAATGFIATVAWGLLKMAVPKSSVKCNPTPEGERKKLPIVYRKEYNILSSLTFLEKLHPFDTKKWGRAFDELKTHGWIDEESVFSPDEIGETELRRVHTPEYLAKIQSWRSAVQIAETFLPPFYDYFVLKPLRMQTAGTKLAASLALDHGWAINLGGGFHHASGNQGGGFCFYADITIAVRSLLDENKITKAMIVDLDAHQGNGHERDFLNEKKSVYILDMFNRGIYPRDEEAKNGISKMEELLFYIEDEEYLRLLRKNLQEALTEFSPDIVVYNAGTDILDGDQLGMLSISKEGIIARDELVFQMLRDHKPRPIPVIMVTSGGYHKDSAGIIAASIQNLMVKGLIGPKHEKQGADFCMKPVETETAHEATNEYLGAAGEEKSKI